MAEIRSQRDSTAEMARGELRGIKVEIAQTDPDSR